MPSTKPRLSLVQIINMSVGFFGIQFAFGLQNANVSRIFQSLGAEIGDIPILWIAAPLTGLLIQPVIGHMSDKTWMGKLGRRRPYFLTGAIFASLALLVFPNASVLWMAAVLLWVLDASINVSMEPFRAFVGDMLPDSQRTTGFAAQSFFIGIGAVISSILPYILEKFHIQNEAPKGSIPDTVRISFYAGAVIYMLTIAYTVLTTREYSPEELKQFGEIEGNDIEQKNIKTSWNKFTKDGLVWLIIGGILTAALFLYNSDKAKYVDPVAQKLKVANIIYDSIKSRTDTIKPDPEKTAEGDSILAASSGIVSSLESEISKKYTAALTATDTTKSSGVLSEADRDKARLSATKTVIEEIKVELDKLSKPLEKELYVLTMGLLAFGLFQIVAGLFHKAKKDNGLVEVMDDLRYLPVTMKKLAVVQFFSWFALFSMWIYSTPALAQHLYHTTDTGSPEYNKIGNWVGVLFACYNGFAALSAFLLPVLAKKFSRPVTHLIALVAGGLGLISYIAFKDEKFLIISMAGIGFAWSSILAMPYSMLTQTLPARKMGVYMGIFNFFIVIPQILAATLLGFFTTHLFHGEAIYAIVLGGCSMIVAALLNLRIKESSL